MTNSEGLITYVGKAKSIRLRLRSYQAYLSNAKLAGTRLHRMVYGVCSIDFIVTKDEASALVLEAQLIRGLKPRYNVLLRNDKWAPYIKLNYNHKYPKLEMARHKVKPRSTAEVVWFGPFSSGGSAINILEIMQKSFKIRNCSNGFFDSRRAISSPCMEYQLNRCLGPCAYKCTDEEYMSACKNVSLILKGDTHDTINDLHSKMLKASIDTDYEAASNFRDQMRGLLSINRIKVDNHRDGDYIALYAEGSIVSLQVFSIRSGYNLGNREYKNDHDEAVNPNSQEEDQISAESSQTREESLQENGRAGEVDSVSGMSSLIMQIYMNEEVPDNIFLKVDKGDKSTLTYALRQLNANARMIEDFTSEEENLLDIAYENAKKSVINSMATNRSVNAIMVEIKQIFGLSKIPSRIESFDNSHLMGSSQVACFIVYENARFKKKEYKSISISDSFADDFDMMRKSIINRFNSVDLPRPDLLLIDGGKGQLSSAKKALEEMGMYDQDIIAITKPDDNEKSDKFFTKESKKINLSPDSRSYLLLSKIRDETHKFAITSHIKVRAKAFKDSGGS